MLLHPIPKDLVAFAPEKPGVFAANCIARVRRDRASVEIIERSQLAVGAGHHVNLAEEAARLRRKALLDPLANRVSSLGHAALRLVGWSRQIELVQSGIPT